MVLFAVSQPASNAAQAGSDSGLPAPKLIRPSANARVPEPVTFEWTDVAGATGYTLQVYRASTSGSPPVIDENTGAPRFTVNALPSGPLWWRVRAVGADGVPGRWSGRRRFEPSPPPLARSVFSIALTPSSVPGGLPGQALLTLTAPAPAGGARVDLSTSDDSAARVPSHAVFTSGEKTVGFNISTTAVSANRTVQIFAKSEQSTRTTNLTVVPPPPPARLASFGLSPATLPAGGKSVGTLLLTDAAPPPSGVVVQVASDDHSLADVPASVTVPSGQRTGSFEVKTTSVTISKSVRITVSSGSERMSAVLTLAAAATLAPLAAPVPQSPAEGEVVRESYVWFQWSDVMGAASYTIEVDDSITFDSDSLVTRTIPAPGVNIGPLAGDASWWRVRANDENGAPGRWSAPRRL